MELDKETQKQLRRANLFSSLVATNEWKEAKNELVESLQNLLSIHELDERLPAEDIKFQIAVRKEIVAILYNWLGRVETKGKLIQKNMEKPYVVRK